MITAAACALCHFGIFALTPFRADKVEILREDTISVVHLIGNVVIERDSTRITSDEALLNETEGYVRLFRNVSIRDQAGDITAAQALYYFKNKKAYLSGGVSLLTDNEIISSDSLDYDGLTREVLMHRGVVIVDKRNDLTAFGERGWYDLGREYGSLTGAPRLEVSRSGPDSAAPAREPMTVVARSFTLYTRDDMFWGHDSVVAIIDSITVVCDTFAYHLNTEHGTMVRPVVTEKANELSGTQGSFQFRNKAIEYFSVAQGSARYFTREGSMNLVTGQEIKVLFENGEPSRIVAGGGPRGKLLMSSKNKDKDAGD